MVWLGAHADDQINGGCGAFLARRDKETARDNSVGFVGHRWSMPMSPLSVPVQVRQRQWPAKTRRNVTSDCAIPLEIHKHFYHLTRNLAGEQTGPDVSCNDQSGPAVYANANGWTKSKGQRVGSPCSAVGVLVRPLCARIIHRQTRTALEGRKASTSWLQPIHC